MSLLLIQATTGLADTVLAETAGLAVKLSKKNNHYRGKLASLFTGFEDTTCLEDKKDLTIFSLNRLLTVLPPTSRTPLS